MTRKNISDRSDGSEGAIQEAFQNPDIEQIVLGVAFLNPSANHIYEEAGFKEYGRMKNYFKLGNTYLDQRLMEHYR